MKRVFALLALLFIAACSGSGTAPDDDGGNPPPPGGGTVTRADTVWVQDMETFADQLELWAGESPDTIAARALDYLQALPSVQDAGITDGTTVWANFSNGFDLVIPNNRSPSTQTDTLVDASALAPQRSVGSPRRISIPSGRAATKVLLQPTTALELPVPATFRAINAIGTCHINPLPVIRSLLNAGNYADAHPGPGTVAGLKNVHGDGVFYINSHGGAGFDANQQAFYAVWTVDPIDVATLGTYKGMVARHELVGMLETSNDAQGNCTKVMHYGFTSTFVRKYMSFPRHSLVIVDACSSASGPAAGLRQAFKDKGASVYVGWSRVVNAPFAYAAMKYLIDRLLGINVISPESPKQRAFNIDDVWNDMAANRNLVIDPSFNAVLTVDKLRDDFGLLAPTIQFLSVEEIPGQPLLIIAGIFGTDPGEAGRAVKINGQPLNVRYWQSTLIACDLPQTGPDAAGTVVVEVGGGPGPRRSNEVNLTQWEGTLTYERDDACELNVAMEIKVRFRADIHAFRDLPHEQPFETTVLFSFMEESSVKVTTGGQYVETTGSCTDTFTFTRGFDLPWPGSEDSPDGTWSYFGSVDSQSHTLQFDLCVVVGYEFGTWVRSGTDQCPRYTTVLAATEEIDDCLFDDLVGVTAFRMQMGSDYDVPEDDRGPCTVPSLIADIAAHAPSAQVKMHWDAMTPSHPPDPDAAR